MADATAPAPQPASRTARRRAQCVREVGNFSRVEAALKYDGRAFDPARFLQVLPQASPKLVALLRKIAELDARDLAETGKVFKHCVFVNSKSSTHGPKLVAAALYATGYRPAYDRRMALDVEALRAPTPDVSAFGAAPGGTFALMCSSTLYGKKFGVRFQKAIQGVFNARPQNVHGEFIRIIVLDQGFREGIDLYDTKYAHIFEELDTPADEKQAVGRNTRYCGQRGLEFHPTRGWPLYVYRYATVLPEDMREVWAPDAPGATRLFDLYLREVGVDLARLKFAATLDAVIAFAAADHDLTESIHAFRPEEAVKSAESAEVKGRVSRGLKKLMAILQGGATAKRKARRAIAGPPPPKAPGRRMGFFSMRAYVTERFSAFAWPKPRMENLCAPGADAASGSAASSRGSQKRLRVSSASTQFLSAKSSDFSSSPKSFKTAREASEAGREAERDALRTLKAIARGDEEGAAAAAPAWIGAEVPKAPAAGGASLPAGVPLPPKPEAVTYSPTQEFVRSFFVPSSAYKGLLLAHSVGTGKTCTGIAVATSSYIKAGYSVLWVTRYTLRADLWKNVFRQVCDDDLRRKIVQKRGAVRLPEDALAVPPRGPMRFLPRAWLPPISFKQFTNMLKGKNEVYAEMVRRNGKTDPLKKTLIIIDEAHKLYDTSFAAAERPDTAVLAEWIHKSYATSGDDSCRVLLMTATPYTSDPMQFMSLVNLMRPAEDALPEDFAAFSERYLDERGRFTEKSLTRFLDEISGYVSYLNREKDARTFAYPVYEQVSVGVSRSDRAVAEARAAELEARLDEIARAMDAAKTARVALRDRVRADKARLVAQCSAAPTPAERKACAAKVADELGAFQQAAEADLARRLEGAEQDKKEARAALRAAKAAARDRKGDFSQEAALTDKCGLPEVGSGTAEVKA